ncbi:MAG: hypothetical protein DRP60_09340 [Spirochaetes bacterium]|nr:MAG: hypothetical protein DRP60_09340 [Spirochaetota bacterium]
MPPVPDEVGLRTDGSITAPTLPPASPNCVSSYVDVAEEAQAVIRSIVEKEERTEILADVPGYIHAVQYTAMWKFPDDIEFWFPVEESAARLGSSDLGVNRKRMEHIRDIYIDY